MACIYGIKEWLSGWFKGAPFDDIWCAVLSPSPVCHYTKMGLDIHQVLTKSPLEP